MQHQKISQTIERGQAIKEQAFINELRDEPYNIRGSNYKKALNSFMPTKYNRLALMAVSVFHLSHWRLSVTVTNYIL
ncbi:hypothetical protein [Streptococcus anginosus]|uniref:hypothetical protein n=1 Tax=Streptococcus anginosus TaxID=1328 RepID=UPI0022E800B4|nr:hypothetical protein [Streptococcus anginosus]